jgi:glyoxylase-like metal-dependent hydrolase (beta-lactamase superfamily II)
MHLFLSACMLALACAAAGGAPGIAAAAEPATIAITPVKVGAHSWYVQGRSGVVSEANQGYNANAGFVVTREGVVVFDVLGTPPLGEAYLKAIRRITAKPVKLVVVSHYHADHFYGLAAFRRAGARIWAHRAAQAYLASEAPAARLAERCTSLARWVDCATPVVAPDRYLDGDEHFRLGGLDFLVQHVGPAHTPEDLMLTVRQDGVAYVGDLIFAGRVPFVGDADSRSWLGAIDKLLASRPRVLVTGHGRHSDKPGQDLLVTREYLLYLRDAMGAAVRDFVPFEEAFAKTDWSRFSHLPAFAAANRINAFGTYIRMEQESLAAPK